VTRPIHFGYEAADVNGAHLVCDGASRASIGFAEALCTVPGVTCEECRCRLALALATRAERCPYCHAAVTDAPRTLHRGDCPVLRERSCSICGVTDWVEKLRGAYDDRGRFVFECVPCQDEHPRQGRYSFGEPSRGAEAKRSGVGGAE